MAVGGGAVGVICVRTWFLLGRGYGVNEERTSPGAGLFTPVGYHSGGALSRDIVSTCLAQDFFTGRAFSPGGSQFLAQQFAGQAPGRHARPAGLR